VGARCGHLTAVHAAGQCAGPLLAGVLADTSGGVGDGVALGATFLAIAAAVASGKWWRHLSRTEPSTPIPCWTRDPTTEEELVAWLKPRAAADTTARHRER